MKPNFVLTALLLLCIGTLHFGKDAILATDIAVKNTYLALEHPVLIAKEQQNHTEPIYYYRNKWLFMPLSRTKRKVNENKDIFWLQKKISPADGLTTGNYVLSFNYLSFVDLTLLDEQGKTISYRKAGLFRKLKYLTPGDGREHFALHLEGKKMYTMMLRVKHVKGYTPLFDFHLQKELDYLKNIQHTQIIHALMEGAIIVLLLYICFSWLVSRYRPYIWIFFFLLSIGIYSFALQDQFIDLILPNRPQLGWSALSFFSRLGAISFYLLAIDFLELKKLNPIFYKLGLYIISMLTFTALFSFISNYYFYNYKQTNWITLAQGIIHILYFSNLFISIWKKIDQMQRYLAYGSIFFVTGVAAMVYCGITLQEQAVEYVSMLTQFFALSITMLLLIGIRLKIRKSELDYHKSTESIVHERTAELKKANNALYEQQIQLLQKNQYIETLIEEVNHRVKNNLQLLYSLGSIYQQGESHGTQYNQAIQSMQERIHAMMLVNQLLVYNQNSQLKLNILVLETVNYLRQMYDPEETVRVEVDVVKDWLISTKTSIPLALIITELLTNSYKYAFPQKKITAPMINLSITKKDSVTVMKYKDNGEGVESLNLDTSFGINLVQDLTRQIKGTVTIKHFNGFQYLFEFKDNI